MQTLLTKQKQKFALDLLGTFQDISQCYATFTQKLRLAMSYLRMKKFSHLYNSTGQETSAIDFEFSPNRFCLCNAREICSDRPSGKFLNKKVYFYS